MRTKPKAREVYEHPKRRVMRAGPPQGCLCACPKAATRWFEERGTRTKRRPILWWPMQATTTAIKSRSAPPLAAPQQAPGWQLWQVHALPVACSLWCPGQGEGPKGLQRTEASHSCLLERRRGVIVKTAWLSCITQHPQQQHAQALDRLLVVVVHLRHKGFWNGQQWLAFRRATREKIANCSPRRATTTPKKKLGHLNESQSSLFCFDP